MTRRPIAPRIPAAGRILLLAGLLGPLACGGAPKDAVVSMKGWNMTLPQVRQEYERVNGEGSFDSTSIAQREEFCRTLADKELLLAAARRENPRLKGMYARIVRITYEKALENAFMAYKHDHFRIQPDQLAEQLRLVSREATIRLAMLPSPAVRQKVLDAQAAGKGFEEIANTLAVPIKRKGGPANQPPLGYWKEMVIRVDDSSPAPLLVRQALVSNLPEGGMSGVFQTPGGTFLLQVLKLRPLPEASDSSFVRKAKEMLQSIDYMDYFPQWTDSLRQAAGFAFREDAPYEVIRERFQTFWDSINAVRARGGPEAHIEFRAFRSPLWLFTAEEQARPLYTLRGKTCTVGDYLRSLDDIDLDYWPTTGPLGKIQAQVQGRLRRLLHRSEAEKLGVQNSPEMVERMKRVEEENLLEQYHDGLAAQVKEPTPEEIRAAFDSTSSDYLNPELVSFSALTYPPAREVRAKAALARLRSGGPLLWFDLAPAEQKADSSVRYLPPTDLMDVARPAPNPAWTDFHRLASTMEAGQISDLIRNGYGISIMRVMEHRQKTPMSFEDASPLVRARILQTRQEKILEAVLSGARRSAGVRLFVDRLGAPGGKAGQTAAAR